MKNLLDIQPEVFEALNKGKAIVALESTIISHGMPYPENVETAMSVENTIRNKGAIPATLAIIDGKIKVGLTQSELEFLGNPKTKAIKCSSRDLPLIVSRKLHGATTVAATMIVARMAGIHVFGTGGIGGVHRGAQQSLDISADMQELSWTNVAVVSAGIKAILDIGLTLEYLETHGVPVIGYRTDHFPAFYSRNSGFPVDYRMDTPEDLAKVIDMKWKLGLHGGVLIANPIPQKFEMQHRHVDRAITQAIAEANRQGITGKAITPFLLSRIGQITDGASLESNIHLVLNNADLAAEVAVELAKIESAD